MSWNEVKRIAQNRVRWKAAVDQRSYAPVATKRNKSVNVCESVMKMLANLASVSAGH